MGIALCAKLLEEQLQTGHSPEANKASIIARLANEAAKQARLSARTLEGADGVGDLKVALKFLATTMSHNGTVKVALEADSSSLPISAPVAAQLYRIAQEAVRNAVEHGAARAVQIKLLCNVNELMLTIEDDGKGFNPNITTHRNGLKNLETRVRKWNGDLKIDTTTGKGTRIEIRMAIKNSLLK